MTHCFERSIEVSGRVPSMSIHPVPQKGKAEGRGRRGEKERAAAGQSAGAAKLHLTERSCTCQQAMHIYVCVRRNFRGGPSGSIYWKLCLVFRHSIRNPVTSNPSFALLFFFRVFSLQNIFPCLLFAQIFDPTLAPTKVCFPPFAISIPSFGRTAYASNPVIEALGSSETLLHYTASQQKISSLLNFSS
jgi:hypothetical protein